MNMRTQKMMWATLAGLGAGLLVFMVTVENEPGAIPLMLILVGAIGYVMAKKREKRLVPR